jgi:predicted dehydrogenase
VVERYHLPALSRIPQIRVTCLVEPSPERLRTIAARVPGTLACADLEEALATGVADAALIASPPAAHADLARRCLAGRWHVLIEKPMAVSMRDAADIRTCAQQSGRRVAIGFNRRFRPSWSTARDLLADYGPSGWDEVTFTMAFDTTRWRSAANLEQEAPALAGLLEDVVPHQVDLLAFLFDRRIVRVRADQVRFRRGHSVELAYAVQLRDGSAVRCRALHMPGHLELLETRLGGRTLAVTPDGAIRTARLSMLRRRCTSAWGRAVDAGRRIAGQPSATVTSFLLQMRAFEQAVRGEPAGALADDAAGVAACAVGDAIRASVAGGDWTEVDGLPE